jgi:hypothetical protein
MTAYARARLIAAAGLIGSLAGCRGFPFGTCSTRVIEMTMTAAWGFDGESANAEWLGALAETNLDPQSFRPIADAFENPTTLTGSLSWLLPAFDANPGALGVLTPLPLQPGARLTISGVTPIGGFVVGTQRLEAARVDVRAGDFLATHATGVIEVIGVSPLRLWIDLATEDGKGRTLALRGQIAFWVMDREVECS